MTARPSPTKNLKSPIHNSHPEQARLLSQTVINSPLPRGVTAFASGMNRLADIHGAAAAGVPIGVDVSKVSESVVAELIRAGAPMLLDSGAFGEIRIRAGKIYVAKEIDDLEWRRRLAIYLKIARAFQGKDQSGVAMISVIAPDRVGSQEVTLSRLSKFRQELKDLRAVGADILVTVVLSRDKARTICRFNGDIDSGCTCSTCVLEHFDEDSAIIIPEKAIRFLE